MRLIPLLVAAASLAWGQTTCQPSARAIFLAQSGAIAPSTGGQVPLGCQEIAKTEPAKPTLQKQNQSAQNDDAQKRLPPGVVIVKVSHPVPVQELSKMSAMMFWIELVRPNGEKQRVTTDRVFHSGERFQLHVESSVTGRLVVYQRAPDGKRQLLFPDPAIYAGDNLVRARVETVIPSAGRIRFDETPGTETLIMVLTPSGLDSPEQQVAYASLSTQQQLQSAEEEIRTVATRGFVLEAVSEPGKEAEYAASTGPVAVEIKLKHQ